MEDPASPKAERTAPKAERTAPKAERTAPKAEHADKAGGGLPWRRLSRWYWGAIGVIALAALARFFQAAPVATPTTVVSAPLTPDVTLQIAYPLVVRPVLREADRAPLVVTLRGVGAISYTVALSTSEPLLFTDNQRLSVEPRARLAIDGCCQSSALFYPQAGANAWHQQPVAVSAYAAPFGALPPNTPTLAFTLALEPVWLTWGRRALLLFAELGLAVSVALALAGWAIEQQRREEEQKEERRREQAEDERQQRQHEAESQEALWRSRIALAQQTGARNLLAGAAELVALRRTLGDSLEGNRRRTELVMILQAYSADAANPNSLAVEACLEQVAARLLTGQVFSEDELDALTILFDHVDHVEHVATGQDSGGIRRLVEKLSRRNDATRSHELLQVVAELSDKFEYSLAIANLTVELIREWWTKLQLEVQARAQNDDVVVEGDTNVDEALALFANLMSDPRLVHIPFKRRTHLHRLPTIGSYQYPWANPDTVAAIAFELKKMLGVEMQNFAEAAATAWSPLLPAPGFVRQPRLLRFPVHEDAECAAHLLRAHLTDLARRGLQRVDGASRGRGVGAATDATENDARTAPSEDFTPFTVAVALQIDVAPQQELPVLQLKPVAHAIAKEWLRLLACSPLLWGGLEAAQRSMLAALLQMVVRTQAELQYRLRQHHQSNRCRQQDVAAGDKRPFPGDGCQRDDVALKNLAANIASHWCGDEPANNVQSERLETWLTLRPHYFTHTVVVALVYPAPTTAAHAAWWRSWFHLQQQMRAHDVIVQLLTAQTPDAPPLRRLAEDCAVPRVQLAALLDDAFGFKSLSSTQRTMHNDGDDGCKIEVISRLLDNDSLDVVDEVTDALLNNAEGSPSRLLHMMHLILKHRIANLQGNETEFTLSHLDIMNVVQTYPKDR